MYITIEMDDRKRIELDGVKTAEEARAEVEEIREPWIWSVVIDGAYFEKKYYDRWSRELTRYDDEGRAL